MQKLRTQDASLSQRGQALFDLLIFDWDGTAVADRATPIPDLLREMEAALKDTRLACVIVTGTNVDNLLSQGLDRLSPDAKQALLLCTNRGSEVWSFDANGSIALLYRREASANENTALDRAIAHLQSDLASMGLKTKVISNRLNRRKLDLIPDPLWAAPKKAQFRDLLIAVNDRLAKAKITGGLAALIQDAYRVSRASGLSSPRVTSDIKHIEIGLTDKSDSAVWAYDHLIAARSIPLSRVAVIGDEFGSIGGIQGSDALLHIPELQGAKFFSVGAEPEGVPPFVEHRPGGPDRFLDFLHEQIALRKKDSAAWQVIQEGFDPSREREMEALFAIGNGRIGARAAADFPVPAAQPDLFVAGIYDKKVETLPYSEVELLTNGNRKSNEAEIVPFPSPLHFDLHVDGNRLSSAKDMTVHTRTLDLKRALYSEEHRFEDPSGRITEVRSTRCVSLADPYLLIQTIHIRATNHSTSIEITFSDPLSLYPALFPHVDPVAQNDPMARVYRTKGAGHVCAIVSKVWVNQDEVRSAVYRFALNPGEEIAIHRSIYVLTSRDAEDPLEKATEALNSTGSVTAQFNAHMLAWQEFWSTADITFSKELALTQAQRFNLYHMRVAANDHDSKVSIPAKGLTGRAYEGHVFWDTEIFMLPVFLYSMPSIARELLLYRFHTLDGARARAKDLGYRGACYAWESTLSGKDVTPKSITIASGKEEIPIFTGTQQIHVTADVAFAVWKYWDATLDDDFLARFGVEILAETARFWQSRVRALPDLDNLHHILGVVGPDEYHHDIDDNAYTNWMAKVNLEKAAWAVNYLKAHYPQGHTALASKIALQEHEGAEWAALAQTLYVQTPNARGIIEQFRGFHDLKSVAIPETERHHAPISRLFHWNEINERKLVKQADVLMIPFLFPDAFSREIVAANYHYYEPLTDHNSSLSLCVHAAIAAQIGLTEVAREYWEKSLNFDLSNAMSNTALGIHEAAIGGSWQALIFHLLGVRFSNERLTLEEDAQRPPSLAGSDITFKLRYRGTWYPVHWTGKKRLAA